MQYTEMIRQVEGPYNLNTYFLICKKTRQTIIIDPGGYSDKLLAFINKEHLIPYRVLMSHGHTDHLFSMEAFKKTYPIPYCIHGDDDLFFKDEKVREKTRSMVGLPPPHPADIKLSDQDQICFGESVLKVIHTPGHTPGSVCFLCENHLFTGDAIFVGEAGRVDLPGGDINLLIDSIKTRILTLDKKTVIHPGHHHTGSAFESTIEKEMKDNIYITDFILDN